MERDARKDGAGAAGEGPTTLIGTIERVTFANEESLYSVLGLSPEKGYEPPPSRGALFSSDFVTAVGKLDQPTPGLRLKLTGRWTEHRAHGQQFEFEGAEVLPPADRAGIVKYLASDRFPGIGETLASRIVDALGPNTFTEILEHPEKLNLVRGLRAPVKEALVAAVIAEYGTHRAHGFLRNLGLGPVQSATILRKLGLEVEEKVRADPYVLASGFAGIGFTTADKIASHLGFAPDDPRRARAAVLHALKVASEDGHSLQQRGALIDRARDLVSGAITVEGMARAVEELRVARSVIVVTQAELATPSKVGGADAEGADGVSDDSLDDGEDPDHDEGYEALVAPNAVSTSTSQAPADARDDDRVYLPWLAHCEAGLARNVARCVRSGPLVPLADAAALARHEAHAGIQLHPRQREAVLGLLAQPIGLLTGGPGVGKTTIVRFVVNLARGSHANVLLASPTGRAAKRLAEAAGMEAQTIHRLLGYDPEAEGFAHNERNPLECDLLVVDEISMLDVVLAHHLFKAIAPPTRVVLVGDPDQLPSVGPGNVLHDMIRSGVLPVFRLTQIYRQAQDSLIVTNAHRILQGEFPLLPQKGDKHSDFYFFQVEESDKAADRLIEVVTKRIPETFGMRWIDDVQVIAPMYRGECGVDALNERLRAELGAGGREVRQGARVWRVGDRVIHTRNDYEKEVFNGDMGRIERVDGDGVVVVRFPERSVSYEPNELSDLQPAFAITVHRSQGGEFPAVVVPLVMQHWMMLQRNLLYTALTRARKLVVVVGSRRALETAIANDQEARRESALGERLAARIGPS